MLVIQKRRRHRRDEELRAIGIPARIGHTQQPRGIVLQREILIRELLRPVDGGAAGAVAVEEITALDHKVLDDTVEFGALVALRPPLRVLGLARAELAEVLGGARRDVCEEFDFDASEGLSWIMMIQKNVLFCFQGVVLLGWRDWGEKALERWHKGLEG